MLTDWRGSNSEVGKLKKEAKHQLRENFRRFLSKAGRDRKRGKLPNLQQRRLANKFCLLALDHALQVSLGIEGLKNFQASVPLRALKSQERRYTVPLANCSPSVQAATPKGRCLRVCIVDDSTGGRRWEVQWSKPRPALIEVIDQGSVGWPARVGLFGSQGNVRGWWDPDPAHRRHNNVLDALKMAGLNWAKTEVLLLETVGSGPWHGASFFGTFRAAGEEFFENYGVDSEIFLYMYPKLAIQLHAGVLPSEYGAPSHIQWVWERTREAKILCNKGFRPKEGRWFQVFTRGREMHREWAALELVLLYVGLHQQWFFEGEATKTNARAAVPPSSHASVGKEFGNDGGSAADASETRKTTVEASNQEVEKAKLKTKNLLHLSYGIAGNDGLRALWFCLTALTEPIMKEHSETLISHSTPRGGQAWAERMANGCCEYLGECFLVLSSECILREAGLCQTSSSNTSDWLSDDMAESMCQVLLRYLCRVVGTEYLWLMRYHASLPGFFPALLQNSTQASALVQIREWWECLVAAEGIADNNDLQLALSCIRWPQATWVRELLVGLVEADWKQVPEDVFQEIKDFAQCWKSTKIVEDGFNHLRDRIRHDKGGKLSRVGRTHALMTSSLLEDTGRPPKGESAMGKAIASRDISEAAFHSSSNKSFSLGQEFLDDWMQSKDDNSDPLTSHEGLIWQSILHFRGSWNCMGQIWFSVLALPGTLLHNVDSSGLGGLVLHATQRGVLVLKVQLQKVVGTWVRLILPTRPGLMREGIQPLFIVSLDKWTSLPVVALSPRSAASWGWPRQRCSAIQLAVKKEKPSTLLQSAAREGFRMLTVPWMQRLWVHLKIEGTRPTLEADLAEALIRHVMPDAGAEEVADCLSRRRRDERPFLNTVLTEEGVQVVEDHMQGMEVQEVVRSEGKALACAAKLRDKKQATFRDPEHNLAPGAAASSSAVRQEIEAKAYTVAEAKKMLPKVSYCSIAIHTDSAWEVKYPKQEPPKSHSRSFTPGESKSSFDALKHCLRWVWSVHTELTGQQCPWKLDG